MGCTENILFLFNDQTGRLKATFLVQAKQKKIFMEENVVWEEMHLSE